LLDPDLDKKLRDHLSSKDRLFGEGSPFSELLQNMVNTMLEGEMSSHLALEKAKGNKNKRGPPPNGN